MGGHCKIVQHLFELTAMYVLPYKLAKQNIGLLLGAGSLKYAETILAYLKPDKPGWREVHVQASIYRYFGIQRCIL